MSESAWRLTREAERWGVQLTFLEAWGLVVDAIVRGGKT